MAIQKNFIIRNGLEVDNNLLVADSVTNSVGIGTSTPNYTFEVIGGIGATHINILGISTVLTEFNVGTGGTVITSLNTGLTGFGTATPEYIIDIRSPVSTGQTALYVQGDVRITGDLSVDDISFDQATLNNLEVTGVGTIATASIDLGYVKTGIVTNLSTSGIATITTSIVGTANVNTGVVTTISGSNLNYSGIGSFGSINTPTARIVTGIVTTIDNANLRVSGIASVNTGVVTSAFVNTGIITTLSGSNLSYSGIGSFGSVNADTGRIATGIITTLTGTTLNYSGIGTITDFKATNANVSGATTTGSLAVNTGFDVYAVDSTFHGSVTIEGNLSIGGTSTIINAAQLRVEDKDIVLGFSTTQTPTDDTANHGGIAIASTEGTPLVSVAVAGINTLPDTYKQIMWVKRNTMGAGTTDAFLFNYAVGVGSTQVPNGVRFAAGSIQFTENVINTTNLNATGVSTISTAVIGTGNINTGIITTLSGSNLSYSGIGTIATASVDLGYVKTGIVTNLSTSGIATIATASVDLAYVKTGITTNLITTGIASIATGIITTLSGSNLSYSGIVTAGSVTISGTSVISSGRQLQNIVSLDATTTATIETAIANAPNTSQDIVVTGIASINTGVFTSFFSPIGIITTLSGANINYSGISSFGSVNADTGRINTGIVTNLTVSGISTFTNGPVFIGSATSTGTSDQKIQVTGGAYVSGNTGIGITNPGGTLHVVPQSTSIAGLFSGTTSSDMVRITQLGTGNAILVEDSANPDSTSFVVTGIGSVGIGTNNPVTSLHAVHPNTTAVSLTWGATSGQILRNEDSELAFGLNSFSPFSYYLQARTNANASRQIAINPLGGNVGIATSGPSTTLDVGGTASIKVPVGTTGERPGSPVRGFVRFNTDLNTFEGYNGTEWGGLGGAAEKDTAVSTTSATTCESFAVSTHRSATITAQITQGSNYQVGKYVVIHDGTTATLIEESAIATGSMLGSFTATVSGGNLLFQVNMNSASSATVTTLMTKVSV